MRGKRLKLQKLLSCGHITQVVFIWQQNRYNIIIVSSSLQLLVQVQAL